MGSGPAAAMLEELLATGPCAAMPCAFLLLLAPIDATFLSACLAGRVLVALLGASAPWETDPSLPRRDFSITLLRCDALSLLPSSHSGAPRLVKLVARRVRLRVTGSASTRMLSLPSVGLLRRITNQKGITTKTHALWKIYALIIPQIWH
jgi:hypothetical protein